MAHGGTGAAVVERVMALGAELERNLVPDVSGSGCSSSDAPSEEAIISGSARGKQCLSVADFLEKNPGLEHKEEGKRSFTPES